jgi:hypothetical protein
VIEQQIILLITLGNLSWNYHSVADKIVELRILTRLLRGPESFDADLAALKYSSAISLAALVSGESTFSTNRSRAAEMADGFAVTLDTFSATARKNE